MKTLIKLLSLALVALACSCTAPQQTKTKMMWVDFSVNWHRFSYPDSIDYYVQKCKDAGITALAVEVKGTTSEVSYLSDIAPRSLEWRGHTRPADYDFLAEFVKSARKHGLKIYAAFNIFCEGNGVAHRGLLFDKHADWQSMNYVPGRGIVPVTEMASEPTLFTNPALPEARRYETELMVECAKAYDIDGVMLDRCRYDNIQSDFSDFSRREFEKYIGQAVENYPADIYLWVEDYDGSYKLSEGPLFKQWLEWRASNIYNFVAETHAALKQEAPNVELAAYTGAWYPSYYELGANWASRDYDPAADYAWATDKYKDYAYRELLDFYTNGNYYPIVSLEDFHKSQGTYLNETDSHISTGDHLCVEGACALSRKLMCNQPFCGGMYIQDYYGDTDKFREAVLMNLDKSDGLMIFDICHIIALDWWDELGQAIQAYEAPQAN